MGAFYVSVAAGIAGVALCLVLLFLRETSGPFGPSAKIAEGLTGSDDTASPSPLLLFETLHSSA